MIQSPRAIEHLSPPVCFPVVLVSCGSSCSSTTGMPEIVRHQHRVGYWAKLKGKETRQFVPLTNFGLKLLRHIEAPACLTGESGFVVEVT